MLKNGNLKEDHQIKSWCFLGGYSHLSMINTIDYVTIATTGDASRFWRFGSSGEIQWQEFQTLMVVSHKYGRGIKI